MFHKWVQLIAQIWDNLPPKNILVCPRCGKPSIDYQYVGDKDSSIGHIVIWCKSCLHEIHMSRVGIPNNANVISYKEDPKVVAERIPKFTQINPAD